MSTEDSSSPSRLRARLGVARNEAVHQKADELQTYLSGRYVDASTLVSGDLNAFNILATAPGAPTIDLNGSAEDFKKQLAELGTFVHDLMPAVRYLNGFSASVSLVQRTDDAALEEFKQALTRLGDETGFDVGTLRDGRSLLSYTLNEQIAKHLTEQETIKATLDASLAYLVSQAAPAGVIRAVVEGGAKITNDTVASGETVLSNAFNNYTDIDLLKFLVSKAEPEHLNLVRPSCGMTIAHTMAANSNFDRLQVLVDAGANLLLTGWYSTSAFTSLMNSTNSDAVRAVFEVEAVKKAIIESEPFSLAFYSNLSVYAENLRTLKAIGADPNPSLEVVGATGRAPALYYAVASYNDAAAARVLVELGADVKIEYGGQPLLCNVLGAEIAQLLIDNGATAKVPEGTSTPLMSAVMRYNDDLVRTLIPHSDLAAVSSSGQNALHLAAVYSASAAKLILEAEGGKALLTAKDSSGNTPLHISSSSEIIGALLEGADLAVLNEVNNDGRTPLIQALSSWNISAATTLLEKTSDLSTKDTTGRTALFYAVSNSNAELVNAMLDKGAPIDVVDTEGATILLNYLASSTVPLEPTLLKRLVEGTTNVSAARTADNFSPLLAIVNSRAAYSTFAECVEILLTRITGLETIRDSSNQNLLSYMLRNASGAGDAMLVLAGKLFEAIKAKGEGELLKYLLELNTSDETALHYAAYRGTEETDDYNRLFVAILDAEPQALNQPHPTSQRTPIHIAAAGNNPGAVRILIQRGADAFKADKDGIAPIDSCTQRATLQPLVEAGAKINPAKFSLTSLADDAVELLKDQLDAVPPNIRVVIAAIERYVTEESFVVRLARKYLSEKLVDVNEEVDGNTALCRMSYAGNNVGDNQYEWIKVLLESGADVNKARVDGATPLMEAIRGSNRGALELLLARDDIRVNDVDVNGQTPLTYIAINGKAADICDVVLKKGADKTKPNAEGKLPQELTTDDSLLALLRVEAAPAAAAASS